MEEFAVRVEPQPSHARQEQVCAIGDLSEEGNVDASSGFILEDHGSPDASRAR